MEISRNQLITLAVLGVVGLSVPLAFGFEQATPEGATLATGVPAADCPQANAVFEERGMPAPETYYPSCPPAEQVAAEIERNSVDPRAANAVRRALERGQIKEDQDPATYPRELQQAIGWEGD